MSAEPMRRYDIIVKGNENTYVGVKCSHGKWVLFEDAKRFAAEQVAERDALFLALYDHERGEARINPKSQCWSEIVALATKLREHRKGES